MSRTISHLVALEVTKPNGSLQLYRDCAPVGQLVVKLNGPSHFVKPLAEAPVEDPGVRNGSPTWSTLLCPPRPSACPPAKSVSGELAVHAVR